MGNNRSSLRKKARIMQGTVAVVSLVMIGFVLVWAARNAFAVKDDSSPDAIVADSGAASAAESTGESTSGETSADESGNTGEKVDGVEKNAVVTLPSDDTSFEQETTPAQTTVSPEVEAEQSSAAAAAAGYTGWQTSSSADDNIPAVPQFPTAADITDDFSDAVFIGNSLTVGLGMNCGKPLATIYASTGLNVNSVWDSASILLEDSSYGTVFDGLAKKQFGRVYVMFGINEVGWPYWDVFQQNYEEVVNKIKELQPNAKIYIESVLPVSPAAVNTDPCFTTENIDGLNEYVKNVAANTGTTYLDVNSVLRQEDGSLPSEATTDGIHLLKDYCMVWLKYLADNK